MHDNKDLPADFNTLLLRLYRLSQELPIQHFQDAALVQIKRVLPFDSSMWGTATTKPEGIDIHTVHLHEKSPEMVVAYQQIKHQDSAAASVFGKPRVTHIFHTRSSFPGADKNEFRDFLRRFNMKISLSPPKICRVKISCIGSACIAPTRMRIAQKASASYSAS